MARDKDIAQIARVLGCTPLTVREGLKQGSFPFGTAVKCKREYAYILYPKRVKEVLGIDIRRDEEES